MTLQRGWVFAPALLVALLAGPAAAGAPVRLDVAYRDGSAGTVAVPAHRAAAVLRRLRAEPGVAVAGPEVRVHAEAGGPVTPTDPLWPSAKGPELVGIGDAWARTTGDPSIVVAVVDSGVDLDHPDLAGALVPGVDVVDGDDRPDDEFGHGTEVAGVVAARAGNGIGSAGYCWMCSVMPVRVLDESGNGTSGDVAQGIRWAATHGARIINLSLSGAESSPTLGFVIEAAIAAGVVVVAAAGNQATAESDVRQVRYPAGERGVIGVAAVQADDALFEWSYRGPWVDIAAPGCHVTTRMGGGDEPSFCGTSSAAPAVSGVLGLALSLTPSLAPDTLERAVVDTGRRGVDTRGGRLDAGRLLEALAARYAPVTAPERLAGPDFVTTSIAVSHKAWTTAPTVVLAAADSFADALSAAPLAGKFHAPLLLTDRAVLRPELAAEIGRLRTESVVVVGGVDVVGPDVVRALDAKGLSTIRIAGRDRYDTSALSAVSVGFQPGDRVAYAASGTSFADAVGVGALAAMARRPVVLVDRDGVTPAVVHALTGVAKVILVGGLDAIGPGVADAFRAEDAQVDRLAGQDRFETSRAVVDASVAAGAASTKTWLASGLTWQDALVAAPAAAGRRAVLLLVDGDDLARSGPAREWLAANARRSTELVLVGGDLTVSRRSVEALIATLR